MQSDPNQSRKRSESAKKAARTRAAQKHARELWERRDVLDNRLALDQLISRCERVGIGWMLNHEPHKVTAEYRYELRIFGDSPARAIYHGKTPTHAASKAMAVFDAHKIGWIDE